jgi:hypothetical protein
MHKDTISSDVARPQAMSTPYPDPKLISAYEALWSREARLRRLFQPLRRLFQPPAVHPNQRAVADYLRAYNPPEEAVYRTGRLLFRESWIDELSSAEFDLGKQHSDREGSFQRIVRGKPFPDRTKDAIAAARAATRFKIYSAQFAEVQRWLYDQGIDCRPQKFDSVKFKKWFADKFGDYENTRQARRLESVRNLLKTMTPPGGNPLETMNPPGGVRWKIFRDAVCKDCGEDFDQKTIENDVRAIRSMA